MIKANELRIGNWVGGSFPNMVVHSIDKYSVGLYLSGSEADEFSYENEELEPIPLTPEILEKAGFVEDLASPFGGFVKYISQDEAIRIVKDEFLGYCWPLYGNTKVKVNHFHQLQNLYFALTGEELEINL